MDRRWYLVPGSDDVRDSLADTTRAQQATGYRTLVDFKKGLRHTVEWYRRELPSADAAQARG